MSESTHESSVDIRHEEFDQSFLHVESLHQTWETWFEDVFELVLIKETTESSIGSL